MAKPNQSTLRRIEKAVSRGWRPGLSVRAVVRGGRWQRNTRPGYNTAAAKLEGRDV